MFSWKNLWNWIIPCVLTLRMAPSMYYMNSFCTWTHLLNELNYEDHHSSIYLSYVLANYRWIHLTPIMFIWTHLLNEFNYEENQMNTFTYVLDEFIWKMNSSRAFPAKTRSWQMAEKKQEAENNGRHSLNQKMNSSKN